MKERGVRGRSRRSAAAPGHTHLHRTGYADPRGGIPEFYLNQTEVRDGNGKVLATLELFSSISENPTLSPEVQGEGVAELWLRDNNGNEFKAAL